MSRWRRSAPGLALAVAAMLCVGPSLPRAGGADPDAEIRALVAEVWAGWNTLDPDQAAPYYAQDADLIFFDLAPLKFTGWGEFKRGVLEMFFDKMTSGKVTLKDDLRVTRRRGVAWSTVTLHFSIAMKSGQTIEMDARQSLIWEKRGRRWLIVHEHTSAPLPG